MALFKTFGMQSGDILIFFLSSFRKVRFQKNAFSERWCSDSSLLHTHSTQLMCTISMGRSDSSSIPNVLSASCPSVKRYLMKHIFNFLPIKFPPQNSASSFFLRHVHLCGAISGTSQTHMPMTMLQKLTLNIDLIHLLLNN